MTKIFSILKSGDSEAESSWFHHCQKNEMPFVVVRYRSKLADVEWDYINLPMTKNGLLENNAQLQAELENIYESVATNRSSRHITDTTAVFYNLAIDKAEIVAKKVYEAVSSAIETA